MHDGSTLKLASMSRGISVKLTLRVYVRTQFRLSSIVMESKMYKIMLKLKDSHQLKTLVWFIYLFYTKLPSVYAYSSHQLILIAFNANIIGNLLLSMLIFFPRKPDNSGNGLKTVRMKNQHKYSFVQWQQGFYDKVGWNRSTCQVFRSHCIKD